MRLREIRVEPEEALESLRAVDEISPDEVIISDRLLSYLKSKLGKNATPQALEQVVRQIRVEAATGEPSTRKPEPHNAVGDQE